MKGISAGRRRVRSVFVPVLLATTALTGVSVPAIAQQQAAEPTLDIVVITAQKREENLQRVPVSVQVLGEARLQELHVVDANDYVKLLPSVSSQSIAPGYTVVHMRGVASGENSNHSGPLPTVGTYLDEQPITTIGGTLDIPIFDVARIEALAGPQGTLYGASSEAGTIRIITNKPETDGFAANYTLEVNSVDHGGIGYIAQGMVNIPIRDNLAIRIVAWDEHDAGFIDNVRGTRTFTVDPTDLTDDVTINNARFAKNDYNDVDKLGARAALLAQLSDTWTATAYIMGQTQDSNGNFAFNRGFPATPGLQAGFVAGPVHLGDLEVQHFNPEFARDKWYQLALTVQGKIGNLDLVYSGSHMDRRQTTATDYTDYTYWYDVLYGYGTYWYDDGGNPLTNPSQFIRGKDHFTKDSHEIRLSSPADRRFRWVAGLFAERQTHRIEQRYMIAGLTSFYEITGWPDTIWLTLQDREDLDYAAFGEAAFDITPDLTFTAGIRGYSYDNSLVGFFGFNANYSSKTGENVCFAGPIVPNSPCTDLNHTVTGNGETHKLNLSWRVDDDHMVYATYSTGFRPGGVNRRADFGPYAADTLDNYEIGWKTSWADGRIRWNGAIFYEKWRDFQFSFLGPNSFTLVANAGDASVRGIESDVSWLLFDGLTLTASGAYTDAKLDQDYCGLFAGGVVVTVCPGTAEAPTGTRLPVTSRYKANGTVRYEWPWDTWTGHVQATVAYQSSATPSLRTADNLVLGTQGAFTTADFTAGIDSDKWSIEAFVLNAFDERGEILRYTGCNTAVCGHQVYAVPTRPRTIGLRFGQKF